MINKFIQMLHKLMILVIIFLKKILKIIKTSKNTILFTQH